MGLTLTATQTTAKNVLANPNAWTLLVEISIYGIKSLGYGAGAGTFYLGETITGGTSGATGRLIYDGATPMYLYGVTGTYVNAETITGSISGATRAVVGTQADYDRTLRYAQDKKDVQWPTGVHDYTATSMELEYVSKYIDGSWQDVVLRIFNDATLNKYVEDCLGLEGAIVTLRLVYSGNLSEAAVTEEAFIIRSCSIPSAEWIQFGLGQEKPLTLAFPNARYESEPCRHQFKNATSCQYAGAVAACSRTLATCIVLANEEHFGAYPGIPGGVFK